MTDSLQTQAFIFDARGISKRFRHAAIFGALEALQPGEAMRFVNDHDPLPLLEQIRQRYGLAISQTYIERNAQQVVLDFRVLGEEEQAKPSGGCGCHCSCSGN